MRPGYVPGSPPEAAWYPCVMATHRAQDALTDVPGLRVGHAQRTGEGWLTGTTVVLAPEEGAVAGVDVRGGGPGTRETDALDPRNLVERVHAVVLSGGSAFGLDAASGVMGWLEERGLGVPVGPDPGHVVPVVPAAVLFDLGRGGRWQARPGAALGREAAEAAGAPPAPTAREEGASDAASGGARSASVAQGSVGAGTGALVGGLKGGIGTASTTLESGTTVGVLAAVNAAGSVLDQTTGILYGEQSDEQPHRPTPEQHSAAQQRLERARAETEARSAGALSPPLNTTLAVVATDAELSRPQAQKLAGCAHDGLARAVRPVHLLHDGDTVFALSTTERPLPAGELNAIFAAGADVLARAVVKAVRAAESVDGPGGVFPAYRDLYDRPD